MDTTSQHVAGPAAHGCPGLFGAARCGRRRARSSRNGGHDCANAFARSMLTA
jgi:hypothetical protein